jgi:hypothetical protein
MRDEDSVTLVKKYAVTDTEDWSESRLYWNIRLKGWVNLHNERTPPDLFATYGEAKFLADRLGKFVATIHTDR